MLLLATRTIARPKFIRIWWTTRDYTTSHAHPAPIVKIPPSSKIYAFGSPSQTTRPLVSDIDWTVLDNEAWAVISGTGGGGKGAIFKTLLGYTRLAPPSLEIQGRWAEEGGLYPFLASSSVDPYTRVAYVSFRQRTGGESGAFFDYTARYGAMREEEDRVTVRDILSAHRNTELFDKLTEQMGLTSLLDLPMITLSNGQTRRARVVKAILDRPELLLLDEPLTGLDPPSRKALNETLEQLHHARSPRMIIGLRNGEEIPHWITHALEIEGGSAIARKLSPPDYVAHLSQKVATGTTPKTSKAAPTSLIVDMKDVNVAYGNRKVLSNINWKIRQGDRWHLQGANGSGKTTLLSLLTGDHPQSYIQPDLLLPAFSGSHPAAMLHHRKKTPTAHLRRLIGVVSPEMFDAFPRRHPGMSVWEAVTTGFDGGFVPRTRDADAAARKEGGVGCVDVADEELDLDFHSGAKTGMGVDERRELLKQWRVRRCWEVLEALGPAAWTSPNAPAGLSTTREFASSPFSALSPGEQRLVLLMRALVGRPPLVLLDEVWSGMDEAMIGAARRYLRGDLPASSDVADAAPTVGVDESQAVVVITHWEEEVPWVGDEVKRLKLGSRQD
ncbi:P-loop containing nucleoside triphosphate hydrolase protein [Pholiota conissans]|uniref:P-loop containing nucleoside triphosphate hydrolase protein n=1 Tax=Pholiota conissans TaxID=109636 RepID=A0A9P5YSC4_9AGAR|nr:P-loop containing nucleoside triphosphate hydrolase protein [Pholiota conissans]